jgi:hypothetical protein
MTLRSKTNLLVEMSKLLDKQEAAMRGTGGSGALGEAPESRRLLEA